MYAEVKHADSCPLSMPINHTGNYECTCFIDQARKRLATLERQLAEVTAERDVLRLHAKWRSLDGKVT